MGPWSWFKNRGQRKIDKKNNAIAYLRSLLSGENKEIKIFFRIPDPFWLDFSPHLVYFLLD